ncbi:helix-turn-helix domain-containing protein [Rhizobium sp. LjRoot30]|uniref:helix-turn-helix domain-containing protein n=1 Tax=Rhizobium sp. LjRoot30 TaxID=3342320 RepID=UPI003ECD6D67
MSGHGGKSSDGTNWQHLGQMNDAEAEINALSDADNPPLSATEIRAAATMARVKVIRRALGLTQEEFSTRYQIPLGTLRDWEQGRSEPDQTAKAYLKVIATRPEETAEALQRGAA